MSLEKISIIIPVLNEAAIIQSSLLRLLENDSNIEIIVVDGGSQDNTVELVKQLAVKVILSSASGRAYQMNEGAKLADSDIILFLHADTQLPHNYITIIKTALKKPQAIAGAFRLEIDSQQTSFRLVEALVNWRSLFLSLPYGDQAFFMKTSVFQELGGFSPIPIMEDFELIRRLRQRGKIIITEAAVTTCPRRWHKLGILRTTLINQIIIIGYFLGIPPSKLVNWYKRKEKGETGSQRRNHPLY